MPFRLLGDERKGWIDNTYMNAEGTFRIARGNKGTLFVLTRPPPGLEDVLLSSSEEEGGSEGGGGVAAAAAALERRLLEAVAAREPDARVLSLVAALQSECAAATPAAPARSPLAAGTWRLVWSQQAANASPLQKWGSAQARSYQIIDAAAGRLENVVDLGAAQVRAQADCSPASDCRTDVNIGSAFLALFGGAVRVPLPVSGAGYVDWLYLSERVRVTRGSKGSLFIHAREEEADEE